MRCLDYIFSKMSFVPIRLVLVLVIIAQTTSIPVQVNLWNRYFKSTPSPVCECCETRRQGDLVILSEVINGDCPKPITTEMPMSTDMLSSSPIAKETTTTTDAPETTTEAPETTSNAMSTDFISSIPTDPVTMPHTTTTDYCVPCCETRRHGIVVISASVLETDGIEMSSVFPGEGLNLNDTITM